MAIQTLSAGVDLSQDPIGIHLDNNGDWCVAWGAIAPGTPVDGPGTESAPFAIRCMYLDDGSYCTGYMTFESQNGQWARNFKRNDVGGSTSFTSWVKTMSFTSPVVESVNSATGVVTISLNVT